MIPEDVTHRRGEPVILHYDDGTTREGTIEWGDDTTAHIGVYCERGGRAVVRPHERHKMVPDPGGRRPRWDLVSGRP